ncbi:transposase [mine drainage metagenome]|uniref:Transposase n=3 Tax=mine drainage metagenome TaxID=410659 RepID=T1BSF3_9ZZZZ
MATLADVLRRFGAAYLAQHHLSTPQAKAWRAILACRTAALGGHRVQCDACGHSHAVYHSCRNRHCPQCGARAKDAWLQARLGEVLPVPYAHLVFTLPHALGALYGAHPHWVIDTLFACTAQTLSEFAANPQWLGGTPALSLVLHTWTQDLQRHLHVHGVMACGALAADGHWQVPRRSPQFLFPVHALSRVFRGKFMAALEHARQCHALPRDPQGAQGDWNRRRQKLYQHDWVVYAKTPMGGPAQVLSYLARYTHRTAISNERIVRIDAQRVAWRVRADPHGGKRIVKVAGIEFVRRFLLHVLPTGIKRIRHYGLLAPAAKRIRVAKVRAALAMPTANPLATESAQAFMQRVAQQDIAQCPACPHGRLRAVQVLVALKQLPDLRSQTHTTPPVCHAPPATGPPGARP